jgi:hypothetical protein
VPIPKKQAKPVAVKKVAAKVAAKPKAFKPFSGGYQWYNQDGTPNEKSGLFNRDGAQGRFDKDVKKDKFEKQPRSPSDSAAAKKAGYTR